MVTTMKNNAISPKGADWDDVRREIFTPEEIAAVDIKVALVGEIVKARHSQGYSQKKLEEVSGVKQPVIARLERGTSDPQLSTMIKLLAPLGKTPAVVPLKQA
jgi:ribosome-binding protein aMBF1 (putative translation factor)